MTRCTCGGEYIEADEVTGKPDLHGWLDTDGVFRWHRNWCAAMRPEHEFCYAEWHRCDGGGKGEYDRYT